MDPQCQIYNAEGSDKNSHLADTLEEAMEWLDSHCNIIIPLDQKAKLAEMKADDELVVVAERDGEPLPVDVRRDEQGYRMEFADEGGIL